MQSKNFILFISIFSVFITLENIYAQAGFPSDGEIESKLLGLINPENAKEDERNAKLMEMEALKMQVNKNLLDVEKYSSMFVDCLDTFYDCVEQTCDGKLENCVSVEGGLKEDKMAFASLQCYPDYRTCAMTNLSEQLANIENEGIYPELVKIDGQAMLQMAVNSVFEKLASEYIKLMQKSCVDAGGFYYDGLCGAFAIHKTEEALFANTLSGDFIQKVIQSQSDVNFILPGASLSVDSTLLSSVDSENSESVASAIYSLSSDFTIILNSGNGNIKESTTDGFTFIPAGWDNIITNECFPSRVLKNNEEMSAINQAVSITKDNVVCNADGYIRKKISDTLQQNWSKIFKN
ncbi:MAG: hypothetical protein LBU68_01060 [Rickettsiales bacterium]|jgi:hypothetical protein|nr:hypothetical protein [Rickettsiales bacterium]